MMVMKERERDCEIVDCFFLQGASVIRMLKQYLSEDVFKAGITVSQSTTTTFVFCNTYMCHVYMYTCTSLS